MMECDETENGAIYIPTYDNDLANHILYMHIGNTIRKYKVHQFIKLVDTHPQLFSSQHNKFAGNIWFQIFPSTSSKQSRLRTQPGVPLVDIIDLIKLYPYH